MGHPERAAQLLATQQQAASAGTVLAGLIAGRLGIGATDLKCLFLLIQRPRTPRELATELRLSPSAVTSVIDRLVKAGFADRASSTADRRQVTVTVNLERAQQAIDLYVPLYTKTAEVLADYGDEELTTLHTFAQQTLAILQEEIARLAGS